jgi:anti-repressor protein
MTDIISDDQLETELQKRVKDELAKLLSDPVNIIKAYQEQNSRLESTIRTIQPKADFYDSVTMSDDWMEMSTAVKTIEWAGKPVGRNKMFELMRERGILMCGTSCKNEPYQKYVDLGYFKIVETRWDNPSGETFIGRKTVVSQKGLAFLIELVNEAHDHDSN